MAKPILLVKCPSNIPSLKNFSEMIKDSCPDYNVICIAYEYVVDIEFSVLNGEHDKELKQLKAWKESAMANYPDMQKIGRLIGVPLGQSIHDKIIPFLEKLPMNKALMNK